MHFKIHRGAKEIGGSCVELSCKDTNILLDIGLPLECDFSDDPEKHLPQPLFKELEESNKKIDAVILSHAHLDHYGLAGMLPTGVPVYCGKASSELMAITGQMSPEKAQPLELKSFKAWKEFQVGAFSITPYPVFVKVVVANFKIQLYSPMADHPIKQLIIGLCCVF